MTLLQEQCTVMKRIHSGLVMEISLTLAIKILLTIILHLLIITIRLLRLDRMLKEETICAMGEVWLTKATTTPIIIPLLVAVVLIVHSSASKKSKTKQVRAQFRRSQRSSFWRQMIQIRVLLWMLVLLLWGTMDSAAVVQALVVHQMLT